MGGRRRVSGAMGAVVALLRVAACGRGVPREDFWDRYADAVCDRFERCPQSDYVGEMPSHEECVDEVAVTLEFAGHGASCYDLCFYDEELGARCIRDLHHIDCEDFLRGGLPVSCDEAWDCAGPPLPNCADVE